MKKKEKDLLKKVIGFIKKEKDLLKREEGFKKIKHKVRLLLKKEGSWEEKLKKVLKGGRRINVFGEKC